MKLREVRLEQGLSQRQLAAVMFPGRARRISSVNICQIERGIRAPWPAFRVEVARVLGVSELELFDNDN